MKNGSGGEFADAHCFVGNREVGRSKASSRSSSSNALKKISNIIMATKTTSTGNRRRKTDILKASAGDCLLKRNDSSNSVRPHPNLGRDDPYETEEARQQVHSEAIDADGFRAPSGAPRVPTPFTKRKAEESNLATRDKVEARGHHGRASSEASRTTSNSMISNSTIGSYGSTSQFYRNSSTRSSRSTRSSNNTVLTGVSSLTGSYSICSSASAAAAYKKGTHHLLFIYFHVCTFTIIKLHGFKNCTTSGYGI